ncbi:hypothetical protein QE152_g14140 [Popillia japonica]|uniref:Uncharacterized protein n=1 Tax=Popillia japonica TaxID=7064 RepID=A0AAW1LAC5_POPJA
MTNGPSNTVLAIKMYLSGLLETSTPNSPQGRGISAVSLKCKVSGIISVVEQGQEFIISSTIDTYLGH